MGRTLLFEIGVNTPSVVLIPNVPWKQLESFELGQVRKPLTNLNKQPFKQGTGRCRTELIQRLVS